MVVKVNKKTREYNLSYQIVQVSTEILRGMNSLDIVNQWRDYDSIRKHNNEANRVFDCYLKKIVEFPEKTKFLHLNSEKNYLSLNLGEKSPSFFSKNHRLFIRRRWYEYPNPKKGFFTPFDFSFLVMESG